MQFINERINDRLRSAMTSNEVIVPEQGEEEQQEDTSQVKKRGLVDTTEEELEGFYIVKAILRDTVDPNRIAQRDTQSYFGVLLDDTNRKPICRFYFNNKKQKYVGIFDSPKEDKVPINELNDIFQLAPRLRESVSFYDQQKKE
jgi:hypothetical protein